MENIFLDRFVFRELNTGKSRKYSFQSYFSRNEWSINIWIMFKFIRIKHEMVNSLRAQYGIKGFCHSDSDSKFNIHCVLYYILLLHWFGLFIQTLLTVLLPTLHDLFLWKPISVLVNKMKFVLWLRFENEKIWLVLLHHSVTHVRTTDKIASFNNCSGCNLSSIHFSVLSCCGLKTSA